MKEDKKYKVTYVSGGGTNYNDGIWTLTFTPKRIIAEKVSGDGVYSMHKVGEKIRVGKGTGNPMTDHWDNSFIIYFRQAGTPYYFEPIS